MTTSESDFYHDDPVDFDSTSGKKKKISSVLAFLLLAVGGTFFVQTTLAANIALNTGAPVEFGQGTMQTTACSGASELTVTPSASFTNASKAGAYYFNSITVSGIPSGCNGYDLTLNAYSDTSNSPLALFNSTSSNVVIYSNAGTFVAGIGSSGMTVTSSSGGFTATFTNPVALSSTVSKISIQSGVHALNTYGITWASRTPAAENQFSDIAFGNGIFVAISYTGTGNRVMTSSDGITWITRNSAADYQWMGVVYGDGKFVAVSLDGSGNKVMTSPDGITWTLRSTPVAGEWLSVAYGNGIFVAVASADEGTTNRVMTSPDGITWTSRNAAANSVWNAVTYGNGIFVAVGYSGTGNRVMTSLDGATWTSRYSASDSSWYDITYGNGVFVAVGGGGNSAMTSPDGITWTSRALTLPRSWEGITYGNGIFVAVASNGSGNQVTTSPDGINWTIRNSAGDSSWMSVAYGNGVFVAVADKFGLGIRVMSSTS